MKPTDPLISILALVAAAGCTSGGTEEETTPPDPEPSALEQAVAAIGGEEALNGLSRLRIEASGNRRIDFEGLEPTELVDASSYTSTYTYDLDTDALRVDMTRTPLFEAFQFFPPEVYSVVIEGRAGGLTAGAGFYPPGAMPSQHVGALKQQQRLFNPHVLLREALANPGSTADGGEEEHDGRPHRVLTSSTADVELRLFVDEATGLISKLQTMENSPLLRDVPIEVHYSDWTSQGDLWFPGLVELFAGAALVHDEVRSSVELEPADVTEDAFVLPADASVQAEAVRWGADSHQVVEAFFHILFGYAEVAPITLSQLAPGVTLLGSGHNSVAVEHDGGLVVLEGPNSPAQGSQIVALLEGEHPGVPITHVIQSHHHQDHSAGLRSLAAAGATVVAGHGAGAFLGDVLAAPSTLRPDALSESGAATSVEEIESDGSFVVSDDDVTITAHHISANPHADDMVITVVDTGDARFVYEADLYNAGSGFTVVIGGPESLFAALRALDIIDATCTSAVPLTIVPSHGAPLSLADSLAELAALSVDVGCP
ncbi:MAG: MBL fold metallo-hydrolase [Myxococcales bacterium]|nr:MBL fold metallo-hydrolase [Myxococcales bacterium]